MAGNVRIVDADGHVSGDRSEDLAKYVPAPYRYRPFPPLDHLHSQNHQTPPGSFRPADAGDWLEFMDEVGIESAVLYPTGGLAVGKIMNRGWAVALTRAYNDWLYETYVSKSPRLKAVGLIPLQEPEAAIEELGRIVTQLGMAGAMLPAHGLKAHLGSKEYWPVYAEADRLGCCLGVHGGCHDGFGFDDMNVYAPVHALGHPFGLMISFAGILFNRVFDRYRNLRIGFLEGGVGWLGACLERFDRSAETHTQVDPQDEMLIMQDGEKVSDYVIDLVRDGRLFVGCEGDEATLVSMVRMVGHQAFMYSSDFPHEVNSEYCKHEIAEFLENDALTEEEKAAVLHGNAERFYGFAG